MSHICPRAMIGSRQENGDLPFGYRTARMLMAIARDGIPMLMESLPQRRHVSVLPADYHTIYLLTRLRHRFPERFTALLEDGRITPNLQRNEISRILERVIVGGQMGDMSPISGSDSL